MDYGYGNLIFILNLIIKLLPLIILNNCYYDYRYDHHNEVLYLILLSVSV